MRRLDITDARTFVFALAFEKHRATMPAEPRRDRNRRTDAVAARSEPREIDHVLRRRYDFFNHCFLATCADVIAESRRVNVQRTDQILWEELRQGMRPSTTGSKIAVHSA
jgi:hypothetical protein